ncbi:MAG: type II toxin-antitoxin system VapC family toxin [Proteobacteria bacterium]|nr:type II toxin-antitoxin system VapC family toxin [Pseudomonadota bacterium]
MYLLDTDVLSELRRRKRNPSVAKWIGAVADGDLYLSAITIAEIERGIEQQKKPDPAFANDLSIWLEFTLRAFGDHILPLTVNIARRWGRLSAQIGNKELDLAIAATALEHGLTVVTGNTKHFQRTGVKLLDPFHASTRK